jgi:hypothetical protein
MVYNVTVVKPKHSQICVVYTKKGIGLAIWSELIKAFITPHLLSAGLHSDVLFWQPLDLPEGIPSQFTRID